MRPQGLTPHPQTEEKKDLLAAHCLHPPVYIYTVFYHESSLIVSFIMTIIISISLLLLASLLPHLTFTGENDWTEYWFITNSMSYRLYCWRLMFLVMANMSTNSTISLSLSSCGCGYSEWHSSRTPLQTLHGFYSEEQAPFVRWIPHFWSVCLDCCTLPYEVRLVFSLNCNYGWLFMETFKGILHFFFLEISSFYHSPRVKQLGFTVFKSIQPIFWYLEVCQ